ncbi:MAG: tetratricopeptide repeat protein [Desulfopila sp.]
MKHVVLITVILLTLLAFAATAATAEETEVTKIRMSSNQTTTQIFVTFSQVPEYTEVRKGKRVDIILDASLTNTEALSFTADEHVVKFLTQEEQGVTILTFFLRYAPQRVKTSTPAQQTLVVDILRGTQFSKSYPDLSSRLQGMTLESQAGRDISNPYSASPYSGNWRLFFSRYEPELSSSAPIRYTAPPFPILDFLSTGYNREILPREILDLASQGLWKDITPLLVQKANSTPDPELKKHFALVLGETLLRQGEQKDAFKQLYLLKNNFPRDAVGIAAAYLIARLRAQTGEPHIADYTMKELTPFIRDGFGLSPFIVLGQIETAFATNQPDRIKNLLLKDDIAFTPRLSRIRKLRQSDYWSISGSPVKAFVSYQMVDQQQILNEHPFSLNQYCNILYNQNKFGQAEQCFDTLSAKVSHKKHLSGISLLKNMARLHNKSPNDMYVTFSGIADTYRGTPAGSRAALKKLDVRYLNQPRWRTTSVNSYKALADSTIYRDIAAEASLKEAIVYYELGDTAQSIELLQTFLRNFHASRLKSTAQALLIEQLPGRIKTLLAQNRSIDAIVLAKKHREFFQKNWVDIGILKLLSRAYLDLGIYTEARNLYLYLLRTSSPRDQEKYYLPLISTFYNQGHYELVEDYATQYAFNYPEGNDRDRITLFRLKALIAGGNDSQALQLASSPLPDTAEADSLAAALFFRNGQYQKSIERLEPYRQQQQLDSDKARFILAESYFKTNSYRKAEPLYQAIKDTRRFHDQTLYRLAAMEQKRQNPEKSLKLLRQLVEKGNTPIWQKLAEKELEFAELAGKY